jgi:hypothetical protein
MGIETNSDGLTRRYGSVGHEGVGNTRATSVGGAGGQLVVDFTFDNLPGFDEDAGGGSTPDSFSGLQARIPGGSYIESAYLLITEEWDSAGNNSTLTIGTYEQDGTVIDADGIDAAIAEAAIDAVGDVVVCNGDQVGGVVGIGADDAYIRATTANTPTSGAARLVINYIMA